MMATNQFWNNFLEASNQPDSGTSGLWDWLRQQLDLALYHPKNNPDTEVSELTGRGGTYYVLKNTVEKTYYQLGERDYFLWQRMDGRNSVKDLVVAYFMEYGSFAFARVASLVNRLKANRMLADQPVNAYGHIRFRLLNRDPGYRLQRFGSAFMQRPFAIGGMDRVVGKIYRSVGWLFFSKPFLVFYFLVSVTGIILFARALRAGSFSLVPSVNGSYVLGVIALGIILSFTILTHELAHALTVKHYGREVRSAGLMIYLGMPGFYVDTTDIWMEGKRARLAVTWAGPYSGLILSGIVAIIFTVWPEFPLNSVFYRFAFLSYMIVFFNINPLIKLDGYYMLMDWLEIPNLRRKSLEFLRSGLPQKIKQTSDSNGSRGRFTRWLPDFRTFTREEMVFTIFGALSALWTAYAIYLGFTLWGNRLIEAVGDLFEFIIEGMGDLSSLPTILVTLLLSLVFVLMIGVLVMSMLRKIIDAALRRGYLENTWIVAGLLTLTAGLVVVLVMSLGNDYGTYVTAILSLTSLLLALYIARNNAQNLSGSRLAVFFHLLAISIVFFIVAELLTSLEVSDRIGISADWILSLLPILISNILILLASADLLLDIGIKRISWRELVPVSLGLLIATGYIYWRVVYSDFALEYAGIITLANQVLPWLALAFLLPTLISYWGTRSSAAWSLFVLALFWWVISAITDQVSLGFYLLLASSQFLQFLAFKLLPITTEPPPSELIVSDDERLKRSIDWSFSAIHAQFQQVAGNILALLVADRFNKYSAAARWDLTLAGKQLQDGNSLEVPIRQRGQVYAEALTLYLDLISKQVGVRLTTRMIQNAYDDLPWEQREISNQYCFRDVRWAQNLSQQFQNMRRDYTSLLRRMPIFSTMSDAEISMLTEQLRQEHYSPGKVIIRQGDPGDKFYIIWQGHVEVSQVDEDGISNVVNQLARGDYFGELALLSDAPRNATCKATIPTVVLTLSRVDFDQLVRERFAMRDKLGDSIAKAESLRRIPLFEEMDGFQIQHIASELRDRTYMPGEIIIQQDEIGEHFYVIKSGKVRIFITQDGKKVGVVERGPGEYFGEIALLMDVPRTASVEAITKVEVMSLHKTDFDHLVKEQLFVSRDLERESSRRLMDLRRVSSLVT